MESIFVEEKNKAWKAALIKCLEKKEYLEASMLSQHYGINKEVLTDSEVQAAVLVAIGQLIQDNRSAVPRTGGVRPISMAKAIAKDFMIANDKVTEQVSKTLLQGSEQGNLKVNLVEVLNTFTLPNEFFANEALQRMVGHDIATNRNISWITCVTYLRCFEFNSDMREKLIYKAINNYLDSSLGLGATSIKFAAPKSEIMRVVEKVYRSRLRQGKWGSVNYFPKGYSFSNEFMKSEKVKESIYEGLLYRFSRQYRGYLPLLKEEARKIFSTNTNENEDVIRLCLSCGDLDGAELVAIVLDIPNEKLVERVRNFLPKLVTDNFQERYRLMYHYRLTENDLRPHEEKLSLKLLKQGRIGQARDCFSKEGVFVEFLKTPAAVVAAQKGALVALNKYWKSEIYYLKEYKII